MSGTSGKQWAGRIVVSVQLMAWCAVSALLLHRGIQNLQKPAMTNVSVTLGPPPAVPGTVTGGDGFVQTERVPFSTTTRIRPTGATAGIIMIVIAAVMFLLSPAFLIFKWFEAKKRHQRFLRLAQDDLPPKYEDCIEMERAPKYSTLFPPDPKLLVIPEKHRTSPPMPS
ncbi:unnamed protein product [Bemisia tabaci]|uniref:Uncharacterized protein n=1 Tax=Bemisia tabaci TaxID=7038 RepID=A0A9P0F441_BEMTA|nr:unnamed protein product [Bemisia tabaci]